MNDFPLMDLFYRLREEGLNLTIKQYEWVLEGLIKSLQGNPRFVLEKGAVKRLCQTVWVKSKAQQRIFDECWQAYLSDSQSIVAQIEQEIKRRQPKNIKALDIPAEADVSSQTSENQETSSTLDGQPLEDDETDNLPFPPVSIPKRQFKPKIATAIQWKSSSIIPQQKYHDYPVKRSQLEQSWRKLQPIKVEASRYCVDIEETVKKTVKQGFFTDIVYQSETCHRKTVILLIDTSESMIPFEGFAQQLQKYWHPEAVYYFRNLSSGKVYQDYHCWQGVELSEMLAADYPENTTLIIFSDAGAGRKEENEERIEETERFLRSLIKKGVKSAWLNPYPIKRWNQTSALEIAAFDEELPRFAMFPLEIKSFNQMVAWLRGESNQLPDWDDLLMEEDKDDDAYYRLDPESRVRVFGLDYGENAFKLAAYSAFPLGITPDLIFYLRQKLVETLQENSVGVETLHATSLQNNEIPWETVADILLSDLTQRVEGDLYEFERRKREILLKKLNKKQIDQVAHWLETYIADYTQSYKSSAQTYVQTQQWTALAYTKPNEASAKLASALKKALLENNRAALVRLANVTDTLAEALKGYQPLLRLAEGIASYVRGDEQGLLDLNLISELRLDSSEIEQIFIEELTEVSLAEFDLIDIPVALGTLTEVFVSETVFVDKRGTIIERKPVEAYFYDEKLNIGTSSPLNKGGDDNDVGAQGLQSSEIRMIYIPEGEFWMGSPENEGNDDEKPQHYVKVPSFYMSQTPITQAQWKAIAQREDLKVERELKIDPSRFKGDDRPVERVSWYDAIEYCARLSKLTGRNYRLPSEAEWEYGCRARSPLAPLKKGGNNNETVGAQGLRPRDDESPLTLLNKMGNDPEMTLEDWNENYYQPFHFGETLTSDLANYDATSTFADEQKGQYRQETTPVGTFPPNAFGLYDMHGNVWEWCLDPWHGSYKDAPDDGSVWDNDNNDNRYQNLLNSINVLLNDKSNRVYRGGGWFNNPVLCRSAYRSFFNPRVYGRFRGLRVVCGDRT